MSNPNPINALTELGMRNAESTRRQPVQVDYSRLLFLVVDPAKEMRGAMTMTLSSMGANKVEFATRIGDALSRIQKSDIDIILSEYDLEHSADGLHLLEEIKQRNLCKQSTVFMIVTAERRAQNVIGAVEQAPDDYLLKPFTGEALSKRLDKAIRKKQEFRCVDEAMRNNEYLRAIEECNQRIRNRDEYTLDFMKLKGRLSLMIGDYPGAKQVTVRLVYERGTGRILGGQTAGYAGADRRLDVVAMAGWKRKNRVADTKPTSHSPSTRTRCGSQTPAEVSPLVGSASAVVSRTWTPVVTSAVVSARVTPTEASGRRPSTKSPQVLVATSQPAPSRTTWVAWSPKTPGRSGLRKNRSASCRSRRRSSSSDQTLVCPVSKKPGPALVALSSRRPSRRTGVPSASRWTGRARC